MVGVDSASGGGSESTDLPEDVSTTSSYTPMPGEGHSSRCHDHMRDEKASRSHMRT